MYQGNLSFQLLQKYLDFLTRSGLLKVQESGKDMVYVATDKGRRFLEEFRELQRYSEMVDTKRKALERHFAIA
jgi:predicted transcriptional regulator